MTTRKLPKSVTPEEFVKLIKIIPKKRKTIKIAFLLAYGAGMRVSEVVNCRKEHFKGNSIEIRGSKYGVDRIVPKPKGWRDTFMKDLPIKKSIRSLQRNFKIFAAKAGLSDKYTFHSLRHGFATRMVESGVPLNQVQVLLGHSNIGTTGIYTKARPVDALRSYEELF